MTLQLLPSILDINLLFKDTALKIAPISSVSIFLYLLSTIPLLSSLLNPFQPNFCCQPLPLNSSDQCSILSPHLSNQSTQGISSSCWNTFPTLSFHRILTGCPLLTYQSFSVSFAGSASCLWTLNTQIPEDSILRSLLFWYFLLDGLTQYSDFEYRLQSHTFCRLKPTYHLLDTETQLSWSLSPPLKPVDQVSSPSQFLPQCCKRLSFSHSQPIICKTCLPHLQNNANPESDHFTAPPLLSPGLSHYRLLPVFCNGLRSGFHPFTFALLWSVSSRAAMVLSLSLKPNNSLISL